MPLFQRTFKLVIATCLSIWLADLFQLQYATSAGIIAILSLLDTRRTSFKMARNRLISTVLALFIASLIFGLEGFHLLSLALYLIFYIPLCYRYHLEAGIAPSTVLVTHLLLEKSIAPSLLINELLLFILGSSVSLIINLYMPSNQKEIEQYHLLVEEKLRGILLRFTYFLTRGNGDNDGSLITELDELLIQALELVYLDQSNHLFHQTNYEVHYFEMRQMQNRILRDMAQNIDGCHLAASESLILSQLFAKTALQLSQTNSAHQLMNEIERYLEVFRKRPLPKTREEFETRAILLQLLRDLETFIQLKVEFYEHYQDE